MLRVFVAEVIWASLSGKSAGLLQLDQTSLLLSSRRKSALTYVLVGLAFLRQIG